MDGWMNSWICRLIKACHNSLSVGMNMHYEVGTIRGGVNCRLPLNVVRGFHDDCHSNPHCTASMVSSKLTQLDNVLGGSSDLEGYCWLHSTLSLHLSILSLHCISPTLAQSLITQPGQPPPCPSDELKTYYVEYVCVCWRLKDYSYTW